MNDRPLVVAVLAAGVLAGLAAARTAALDACIRLAVHAQASPALTGAMRSLSLLGQPLVLVTLSLAAVATLLVFRRKGDAARFALAMSCGAVLDATLKLAFRHPRPFVSFFGTPMPDSYSFPSGHALFSVCFFGALAALTAPRVRSLAGRVAIWLAAAVLVLAIGLSRVYLGVHYPSEVVAGYAAGVVSIGAVLAWPRS